MIEGGQRGSAELQVWWINQFAVPPDQPGGTRHYDMAAELRRRGIDCRVVASDLNLTSRTYSRRRRWWSLRPVHEDVAGVPFTWLTAGSYSANDWRRAASMLVFSAAVVVWLLRAPAPRRRSVVIGSSPHLFAALAAWVVCALRRLPFVFEVRDLWPESYEEMTGKSGGLEVRVMRLVANLLYRRSAAVVVLAEPNVARVVARGANVERVHVVPNGIDPEQFAAAGEAPVRLGRDDTFTFVYAGVHGPANGLDVVLDAAAVLRERGADHVRLALLGDGPAKPTLRGRAASLNLTNVTFHGPVPKADVPAVLRTADAALMVLASVDVFSYGVSPNKLFDYLASDLPVVTNVPGLVAGIVEASGAGIVVSPGDPVALADAMVDVARRQTASATALPSGRHYVAERFNRRNLAGDLAGVLERAISVR